MNHRGWWPVILLALVSAGATAATVAAHATRKSTPSTTVATSPHVSVSLPTTSTTAPATTTTTAGPQPTVTTGTLPVAPGPPSTPVTTTAPPPPATTTTTATPPAIGSWPSGRSGYTVVLQSYPESEGRGAALAQAAHARQAGIQDVGVLRSGDFSTLRAGYWVVFAGEFSSAGLAQSAAAEDHGRGYPGAYPARVSP